MPTLLVSVVPVEQQLLQQLPAVLAVCMVVDQEEPQQQPVQTTQAVEAEV
jgi:hypothetical protein